MRSFGRFLPICGIIMKQPEKHVVPALCVLKLVFLVLITTVPSVIVIVVHGSRKNIHSTLVINGRRVKVLLILKPDLKKANIA